MNRYKYASISLLDQFYFFIFSCFTINPNQVTFGALGDSFYEYLLKTWLQGGRKERWLRNMYDRAMDGVMVLNLSNPGKKNITNLNSVLVRRNFSCHPAKLGWPFSLIGMESITTGRWIIQCASCQGLWLSGHTQVRWTILLSNMTVLFCSSNC